MTPPSSSPIDTQCLHQTRNAIASSLLILDVLESPATHRHERPCGEAGRSEPTLPDGDVLDSAAQIFAACAQQLRELAQMCARSSSTSARRTA